MKTTFLPEYRDTVHGQLAEQNLRSCIHCGMCNATCPTYQQLGDELDGPRGRLYLMKQVFEGNAATRTTQLHLDRCLTCRACETTCPSGVTYSAVVDYGRELVDQQLARPINERIMRALLRYVIPNRRLFKMLLATGQFFRPVMPGFLQSQIPAKQSVVSFKGGNQPRKMLILEACGQTAATPNTNIATARVLDKLGISVVRAKRDGCCGAMSSHMAQTGEAEAYMRRNIDAWWPHIEQGVEAIISTASGCGVHVKEYDKLLAHDDQYRDKAKRVADLTMDLSEVLADKDIAALTNNTGVKRVALQNPCTLQHGQRITGVIERILQSAGYELTHVPKAHLCCGSAGTYSVLQKDLAKQLRAEKLQALQSASPDVIATANIGCQLHLSSAADVPVKHWIELLDEAL